MEQRGAGTADAAVIDTVYPGRRVPVDELGLTAIVYPVGFRHLKRFAFSIASVLGHVETLRPMRADESKEQYGAMLVKSLIPTVMSDAMDLFAECVVIEGGKTPNGGAIKLDDFPHWCIPPVMGAWLEESFLEERKWRPWLEVVESLVTKATGEPFSISAMLFSSSPSPDMTSPTSSTANVPDAPTAGGPFPSSTSSLSGRIGSQIG